MGGFIEFTAPAIDACPDARYGHEQCSGNEQKVTTHVSHYDTTIHNSGAYRCAFPPVMNVKGIYPRAAFPIKTLKRPGKCIDFGIKIVSPLIAVIAETPATTC
jgi:hypothetical protein